MLLAKLAITATRAGIVEATYSDVGWAVSFRCKSSGQVACTNRVGEIRHWRKVDTLIRQLRKAGYRGRLVIPVDAQQQLIG